MIHSAEDTQPRNKDIKDNEDHDNEVLAKQKIEGAKRAETIDQLASMGKEEECEEPTEAQKVRDFIEIIIKIGK